MAQYYYILWDYFSDYFLGAKVLCIIALVGNIEGN